MAAELQAGSVIAKFKADLDNFKKGISGVKSEVSALKTSFSAASDGMVSAGNTIIKGMALVGGAVAAAGLAGLKGAADFEQTKIALTTMMGSAEDAGNLLEKVAKFAASTPFEMPELATTTKQLMAFGFSADEAFNGMSMLGDISAGLNVPIGDLAYLLGTLKAQGRAMTIDIRQFAMRGLPIYDELAKVMKVNVGQLDDLITTGKIGFPEVSKALQNMTKEGGKFNGSMVAQSKSLTGLWSTLKDNIGFAMREIIGINLRGEVREGSIFDILRKKAEVFLVWLDANKENIANFVSNLINKAGDAISRVREIFATIIAYLAPIFAYLNENRDLVTGIFIAIGIAIGAAVIAFIAAQAVIIAVFTAIVAAVTFARKAWRENWGGIHEQVDLFLAFFKTIWSVIKAVFDTVVAILVGFILFFTGNWSALWDHIVESLKGAGANIVEIFANIWETAKKSFTMFYDYIIGKFTALWDAAKEIAHNIRESIASAFDKDKRNSPSISDRMRELANFVSTQSEAFRPVIQPAVANGGNQYSQVNNNYINTPTDADFLSQRLGFEFRKMI